MEKRIISVFVVVAMVFGIVALPDGGVWIVRVLANPAGNYSGGGWYYSNGTLTVSSNEGTTVWRDGRSSATFRIADVTAVVIGSGVANIGNDAFRSCASLITVTIPNSVISIGNLAFAGCTNLTSIIIPNSVTSIGVLAFWNCTSLSSLTIPNSVIIMGGEAFRECTNLTSVTIENGVTNIGAGAFNSCTNLTSITIPDSVTSIGGYAFAGCTKLTSIIIPNSVTSIDVGAFVNCTNLTEVTFGENSQLISIGNRAFVNCANLKSIIIPNSVTSIGGSAFENSGLTSVTIPDSVTSIGSRVFENCKSLTSIIIGNSVTSIGYMAFQGCISLTSVTIPDSVTSIDRGAFVRCRRLTSIIVPNSVTNIGVEAFWGCTSLTSVTFNSSTPPTFGHFVFYDTPNLTTIYVPVGSKSAYQAVPQLSGFDIVEVGSGGEWYELFFKQSSFTYNHKLATFSAGLSEYAYRRSDIAHKFADLGFYGFEQYNYPNAINHTVAHTITHRPIDNNRNLIVVALRGTQGDWYNREEWRSNIWAIGGNELHAGFEAATADVRLNLTNYMIGNDLFNDREKNVILITGHSRGGAVGNLLAADLNSREHIANRANIYTYTFASPRTTRNAGLYYNIFNIINLYDIVPFAPQTTIGSDKWDRHGINLATSMPNAPNADSPPSHDMVTYLKWMQSNPNASFDMNQQSQYPGLITLNCPVDVDVYDSQGRLVAEIINGVATDIDSNVLAWVVNDVKRVFLPFGDEYTIKLVATDNGTLTYTIETLYMTSDELPEIKIFENVMLIQGREMRSIVGSNVDVLDVMLLLLDNDKIVGEVLEDGTEITFSVVNCAICKICTSGNPSRKGRVLGKAEPDIFDALEIVKFIVGMDNALDKCGNALFAALITPTRPVPNVPTIFDALEIVKFIVGMDSEID
jgi:hypothetical protein